MPLDSRGATTLEAAMLTGIGNIAQPCKLRTAGEKLLPKSVVALTFARVLSGMLLVP